MNKIELAGNVVRDPYIQTGDPDKNQYRKLAKYTLATHEGKNKATYFECVVFDKLADVCESYVKKGTGLIVCGRVEPGKPYKSGESEEYSSKITVIVDFQEFQTGSGKQQEQQERQPYEAPAPKASVSQTQEPTARQAAPKPAPQESKNAFSGTFNDFANEEEELPWQN